MTYRIAHSKAKNNKRQTGRQTVTQNIIYYYLSSIFCCLSAVSTEPVNLLKRTRSDTGSDYVVPRTRTISERKFFVATTCKTSF